MLRLPAAEGHRAERMFDCAMVAEAVRAKISAMALDAIDLGRELEGVNFCLLPVCGHIALAKAPEACTICGASEQKFTIWGKRWDFGANTS